MITVPLAVPTAGSLVRPLTNGSAEGHEHRPQAALHYRRAHADLGMPASCTMVPKPDIPPARRGSRPRKKGSAMLLLW